MYGVYSFFEGSGKNSTQTQKLKLHTVLVCGLARVYQPQIPTVLPNKKTQGLFCKADNGSIYQLSAVK